MNKLTQIIAREIDASERKAISFARFMELALYFPGLGYYESSQKTIGRQGDFYTNASVGGLFGALLAFQFSQWLEELGPFKIQNSKLKIVEAAAHDGQLAKDILLWLRENRPEVFQQIEYCIIEPSAQRKRWQQETLRDFTSRVYWFSDVQACHSQPATRNPPDGVCGIIFSNELLDAMPAHRIGWDAKRKHWFEWGVALEEEEFVWTRIPHHASRITHHAPPELLALLPDGFTTEISPAAENWWRDATKILQRGKLLTIDYGLSAEEFFLPERKNGTLRAYHRHHLTTDLLANVGEQDITAHVNFSAIQAAGESAGLTTESFQTQPQFLTQILEKAVKEKNFGEWNASCARQFQTLTHPEHLGRAFRVLIQSK